MTNIDYADKHKFISSIGLALIAMAFLLPWMFLSESFDLNIEQGKLNQLTLVSQDVVKKRQDLVQLSITLIPYISIALLIGGIFLLILGLKDWSRQQSIKNETEALTLEMLKRQSLSMTEEQINQKRLQDSEVSEVAENIVPQEKTLEKGQSRIESTRKKSLEIENKILEKFHNLNLKNYDVLTNKSIGGRYFDGIFASKKKDGLDVLVELKYFKGIPAKDRLYSILDRQVSVTTSYEKTTGRLARGIILIILDDSARSSFKNKIQLLTDFMSNASDSKQEILFIFEEDLVSFNLASVLF